MQLPVSTLKVFKRGDLFPGLQSRTVPSPEHESSWFFELCIDNPHTASVWASRVSDKTLGSVK